MSAAVAKKVKVKLAIREGGGGVSIDSNAELPHENALALYRWWSGGCNLKDLVEPAAEGACKPGGPWCIGMQAILEAGVKRGAEIPIRLDLKAGEAKRDSVVHSAIIEGKRVNMVFSYCPCCGAPLGDRK